MTSDGETTKTKVIPKLLHLSPNIFALNEHEHEHGWVNGLVKCEFIVLQGTRSRLDAACHTGEIMMLAHRITGSGKSTTHQSYRPRPSMTEAIRPQTLWLEVE